MHKLANNACVSATQALQKLLNTKNVTAAL